MEDTTAMLHTSANLSDCISWNKRPGTYLKFWHGGGAYLKEGASGNKICNIIHKADKSLSTSSTSLNKTVNLIALKNDGEETKK